MGYIDDDGQTDFLREVLAIGALDGTAAEGITKLVIDRGERVLSPRQKEIFQRYVLDVYVTEECKTCGSNVPWSEMMLAHEVGHCGWREHFLNKDD